MSFKKFCDLILKYYFKHCRLVIPYSVIHMCQHWFRQWLVLCLMPYHYINQCRRRTQETNSSEILSTNKNCRGRKYITTCGKWQPSCSGHHVLILIRPLTHWVRVTHICVGKLTIIGSDNGLSPARRQAIVWTNVGLLLIGPLGTNFSEILIGIQTFSFKKMHLKMSSAKWCPFCLGLNVLT